MLLSFGKNSLAMFSYLFIFLLVSLRCNSHTALDKSKVYSVMI